jgi:Flp pilus assembly pilin Flp
MYDFGTGVAVSSRFWNAAYKFLTDENAPTMAEYGLLLAAIGILVIGGASILGYSLNDVLFKTAAQAIPSVPIGS